MAEYIVIIDGVRRKLNDVEFIAQFGYTPTTPRPGEKIFGGRYEHASFLSGSVDDKGLPDNDAVLHNSGDTIFSISGSK